MKFTDIFIRKPVLAIVVSLFILLLGMRSYTELNLRPYPALPTPVFSASPTYDRADASPFRGFITTPLERQVATAEGTDYTTSPCAAAISTIQADTRLNYAGNEALPP